MAARDRAAIRYCIAFLVLSLLQIILIRGLFTSENYVSMQTDLYVDGADFSPWLSLAETGINSTVYTFSLIVDIVIGVLLSGITMLILRLCSRRLYTAQTRRITVPVTLGVTVLCCLLSLVFSRFSAIADALLLYLPVPVLSWCVFHLGAKPDTDATAA